MRTAGQDEAQAGIKTAGRNMAESKEKLKHLLMKVKEESEKIGLKLKKVGLNLKLKFFSNLKKNVFSTFRKLRSWHSAPSLHSKQMGKQWKQ